MIITAITGMGAMLSLVIVIWQRILIAVRVAGESDANAEARADFRLC